MVNRATLLLGSNLDPETHLPAAVRALGERGDVAAVSSVWQSPAIGDASQPDYCNAAVLWRTSLTLAELLSPAGPLREIEANLGRVRDPQNKYAARTIDIDLCLFNAESGCFSGKLLPDPDLFSRACAAVPVAQIPDLIVPGMAVDEFRALAERLRREQPLTPRPDLDAEITRVLATLG